MLETVHSVGNKKSKERITVLFCCNSDGSDKLIPLIICKSKKPRIFNGVKQLPVQYNNSMNAWMTNVLFNKWLDYLNTRMIKQNKKIVLFLDSFSGHCNKSELSNVRVEFFPKN